MIATRRMLGSAFVALLFVVAANNAVAQQKFSTETLTIESASGEKHEFTVELALDDAQRQQGLMFRKTMSPDKGMLFDFGEERNVTMWMKNTLLALDMLFIGRDGKISHIHENAVPHSEAIISSRGAVKYVLELNGGSAKRYGIKTGDVVRSRQIGN
ncbi:MULTISPECIES: DUF192 domain-containing protein [Rhizobium/Agrobacterium group]|uniref:DUF192 domain-containing protein n=1 Tax=Rhizobium/Agrobacterium group TaxID=227290 RepID=UPI00110E943F|nr:MULTISPECIES: DUF192 domain-containing protein [Rhizobium/Agrobacterium group]NWJ26431.1 DUF192 domain-containing protein [Rhizobium sp. RM]TMV18049.1 DUF192 domain-containing protein [Rhizobium sp. Td3]UXS01602.1 DUF192 domain-containing protein [Agrobacterium tumefaciens]